MSPYRCREPNSQESNSEVEPNQRNLAVYTPLETVVDAIHLQVVRLIEPTILMSGDIEKLRVFFSAAQ